jgi:tRNA (guanine-N7-)-methyltransferase
MSKKKLARFAELLTFQNVFQQQNSMKGRWHSDYFHNNNPIVLELACGKGEYSVNLARRYPDKNFIGIDIKGARLWRGAKDALADGLSNVAFIRIPIETLSDWFSEGEVDEIWITFPDPYLREGKARKRLTSPRFLHTYRKVIKPNGIIHLKTDEPNLYRYSQEAVLSEGGVLLIAIDDLYASPHRDELLSIQTTYEKKHLGIGRTIRYLRFHL